MRCLYHRRKNLCRDELEKKQIHPVFDSFLKNNNRFIIFLTTYSELRIFHSRKSVVSPLLGIQILRKYYPFGPCPDRSSAIFQKSRHLCWFVFVQKSISSSIKRLIAVTESEDSLAVTSDRLFKWIRFHGLTNP